mmetsp:Transcript_26671/g.67871  ORF Transcript_26671/g.67871 Transcript_26671/m.67871 type:complete len:106 (+) Transcript_26671:141-458(+)
MEATRAGIADSQPSAHRVHMHTYMYMCMYRYMHMTCVHVHVHVCTCVPMVEALKTGFDCCASLNPQPRGGLPTWSTRRGAPSRRVAESRRWSVCPSPRLTQRCTG